ncbi:MAG: lysoplasmalogenase [Oleispira sp.]|nr:lysoplasmalogenase [Oleispira sp.]
MVIKKTYYLLIVPIILAYFATNGYGFIFKAAVPASCILILSYLYQKSLKTKSDIWYVLGAFLFSILGDWFLSNKDNSFMMFAAGIALFLIAHIGYMAFALLNGKIHKTFTAVLLIGYLLFFVFYLYPSINDTILMVVTLLYLLISCFSMGSAAGIKLPPQVKWFYFLGVALILFSDTIIALYEFAGDRSLNFLILPTYYAAHVSITFGLISGKNKD